MRAVKYKSNPDIDIKITYREFREYLVSIGVSMVSLRYVWEILYSIGYDCDSVYEFRDFLWANHNALLDKTLEDCILLYKLQGDNNV